MSDSEQEKPQRKRRNWLTSNNLVARGQGMDAEAVAAYEKYVLAQVKYASQGPETVRAEQKKAIERMIPGTLHYYHLFFLDLSKHKDFNQLDSWEKTLYQKFEKKFHKTKEFLEIETAFHVVRAIDKLPKKVDDKSSQDDVEKYLDLMDYIDTQINQEVHYPRHERPTFMSTQAQEAGQHQSSQSEDEGDEQTEKLSVKDIGTLFSKEDLKKTLDVKLKKMEKDLADEFLGKSMQYKIDLNYKYMFSLEEFFEVFNDFDWSPYSPDFAYYQALDLSQNQVERALQLFEMTSDSFWNKVCEFIKVRIEYQNKVVPKESVQQKAQRKFHIDDQFFEQMTLEQLDMINKKLTDLNIDIKQKKQYVSAYFSKQFAEELSEEYQENLSNDEKLKNLENMYSYAKSQSLHKGLISSLLEQMLQMTLKLDILREDLFKEYIERPTEINDYIKVEAVRQKNQKSRGKLQNWNNSCLQNIQVKRFNEKPNQSNSLKNDLIERYLKLICTRNQGSLSDYESFFEDEFIKGIEQQIQVYLTDRGLIDLGDEISPEDYKKIQDQVILRFKETNPEQFKADEAVNITLEMKNIPELVIKVFEFNTETYYRRTMKPLDTSIDLSGLEPSFMKKETKLFEGIKKNKIITHNFIFDELKDKIGTFIIEFQGNGKQSRVIIKKGSLTLIHKTTKGGHIAYLIDEQRKICQSDDGKTGVLVDNNFYKTDCEKNGAIFIPYTKDSYSKIEQVIMISNGFAQLSQFQRDSENYVLEAFFHLNSESVLVGHKTKIFVRAKLTLNQREISIKNLVNSTFQMTITDHDGKKVDHKVKDPKLSDNEDYIFEFLVPSNTSMINVSLTGSVKNLTKNKTEKLGSPQNSFQIKNHRNDTILYEMYLKKVGPDYIIYCLGKNGEPLGKKQIRIQAYHKDYQQPKSQKMEFDKTGKVFLGNLIGIYKLEAYVKTGTDSFNETWRIDNEKDMWTQSKQINIIRGEAVQIPLNYNGQDEDITTYQLSLHKYNNMQVLTNLTKSLKIEPSKMGTYKQIKLTDLEVGTYKLKLNLTASQKQIITITVHQGTYWEGSFILQKNRLREFTAPMDTLRIEEVKCEGTNQQDQSHNLSIQLDNFSENTRVHLLATQFVAQNQFSFINLLRDYCQNKIQSVTFNFAKWQNHYTDGKRMPDEILYVLNRKQQRSIMGNLLDTPSLLMHKKFVRDTETATEALNEGERFDRVNLRSQLRPQMYAEKYEKKAMKKKAAYSDQNYKKLLDQQIRQLSSITNKIKEDQNFLKLTPIQLFNLKPDSQGNVSTTLKGLQNYSQVFIFACDDKSYVQRELSVASDLLKLNQTQIKKLTDTETIQKKDLRQNQKMPEVSSSITTGSDTVAISGGLIELRQTLTLAKDDKVHIQDVTSSKYQIIADLQQIRQVMTLIHGSFKNALIDDIMLSWYSFSQQQKIEKFNENACHELNFFIAKKDSQFFDNYVISYLANKMEKTFFDTYLLARYTNSQKLSEPETSATPIYLECADELIDILFSTTKLKELPILEKCLLIEFGLQHQAASSTEPTTTSEVVKKRAHRLAKNMLSTLEFQISLEFDENDQRENTVLIDGILDLQNNNKPKISFKSSKKKKSKKQMYSLRNAEIMQMNEESQEDEICQDYGESDQGEDYTDSYGGEDFDLLAEDECEMDDEEMCSDDNIDYRQEEKQVQRTMNYRNQTRSRAYQSRSRGLMRNAVGSKIGGKKGRLLFELEDDYAESKLGGAKGGLVGFEDVEKTKEYRETQYYFSESKIMQLDPPQTLFIRDYLKHLLKQDQKSFISSAFTFLTKPMLFFGFTLLDLPLSIETFKKYPHSIESDGHRGIIIQAGGQIIIFKKEIKEGKYNLKKDLIITHKYQSESDINQVKQKESDSDTDEEGSGNDDQELNFYVVNNVYQCEIAVTNLTSKHKKATLLFQVPNGSLPVQKSKYIDTKNIELTPYKTETLIFKFYFPSEGEFQHYPTNSFHDEIITCVSEIKKFDVKSKQVISKVNTFKDLMMLCKSDDEKKQKILKLLTESYELTLDKNYAFNWSSIQFLMDDDKDFFFKISQIHFEHFDEYPMIRIGHANSILKDPSQAANRSAILDQIKQSKYHDRKGHVFSYILRPIKCPIFEISSKDIYQLKFNHLEYFPLLNTRVFSFGGDQGTDSTHSETSIITDQSLDEKKTEKLQTWKDDQGSKGISNIQLRETYRQFLLLTAYQKFEDAQSANNVSVQRDIWLRMVYYLLLQDRVQEAWCVFQYVLNIMDNQINQSSLLDQSAINQITSQTCQIQIDYMKAYFDFQLPQNDNFKTARSIVGKYKKVNDQPKNHNYRIKQYFQKLELQLQEYDDEITKGGQGADAEKLSDNEEANKEAKKKLLPNIHAVEIDEQSGTVQIESANIEKFEIKYYLIDAEILFSRSPFVQNEASTFSYVKPFTQLEIPSAKAGQKTTVPLPQELNHKNVIIEIQSDQIQRFEQYFSCDLKLQIEEQIGEMRVFQKSTMQSLSKVYVKVFALKSDGKSVYFKDGFTDIRGKFEYAKVSGTAVNTCKTGPSNFKKFAIFVSDDKLGSIIKTADGTKLSSDPQMIVNQVQKVQKAQKYITNISDEEME